MSLRFVPEEACGQRRRRFRPATAHLLLSLLFAGLRGSIWRRVILRLLDDAAAVCSDARQAFLIEVARQTLSERREKADTRVVARCNGLFPSSDCLLLSRGLCPKGYLAARRSDAGGGQVRFQGFA